MTRSCFESQVQPNLIIKNIIAEDRRRFATRCSRMILHRYLCKKQLFKEEADFALCCPAGRTEGRCAVIPSGMSYRRVLEKRRCCPPCCSTSPCAADPDMAPYHEEKASDDKPNSAPANVVLMDPCSYRRLMALLSISLNQRHDTDCVGLSLFWPSLRICRHACPPP